MIEPLEDRALMSATLGGFTAGQPVTTPTAVVLPAVQKPDSFSTPTTSNGIIAILIGL